MKRRGVLVLFDTDDETRPLVRRRPVRGFRHLGEQPPVVDFALVEHHMRIGIRGDREVSLADLFSDAHP